MNITTALDIAIKQLASTGSKDPNLTPSDVSKIDDAIEVLKRLETNLAYTSAHDRDLIDELCR